MATNDLDINTIHTGDCLEVMADLPAESVHSVMTSPPYWNLRDYGHDDQLGLEPDSDDYVQNIADVMDEVKRVLRPDGSLWLNIGDSYQNKNKQLIPQRIALELQRRGWVVRNDATWVKPNPMPSSVKDRLNTSTEKLYHFVKNKKYHYELDAIREPHQCADPVESTGDNIDGEWSEDGRRRHTAGLDQKTTNEKAHPKGKNPGDVFEVPPSPFPQAHFAVYPSELCEKPIKATCPDDGIVLDPFAGAGTTLLKAKELGRDAIGIELNPEYADMARARVGLEPNDPSVVRGDNNQNGLEQY